MITEAINKVILGKDLEYNAARRAMEEIMEGTATHAQIASFLTAMRMKGESVNEITACASVMREKAVNLRPVGEVMDIVGTGGDGTNTFNISTTAAFVVAAADVSVAKHGNRSVSSRSGAADVLEALGADIHLTSRQSQEMLDKIGMCFLFAPIYHASMKHAAPVRKEIGVRTLFNILGPLVNPAGASIQLTGVFDKKLARPLAQVMMNLGVERGMVLHGMDGMDEATLAAGTAIVEIRRSELVSYEINPEDFGLKRSTGEALVGGDAEENAEITRSILAGIERGPKREVVLLNSGLALYLAGKGKTIGEGVSLAETLVDSGAALHKMNDFIKSTNEVTQ